MKRLLFYLLLISQVGVILLFVYEFEHIDEKGKEVKLVTIASHDQYPQRNESSTAYVEYEINRISPEQWEEDQQIDYHAQIYVLLTFNQQGVAQVKKASLDKLTADQENEFVVRGSYQYYDKREDLHYVDYGFETIHNLENLHQKLLKQKAKITLLLGKWGQSKVTNIEKAD